MAIILIPGIKGSKLVDTYPTDFKVRWSLEDMVLGNVFEEPLDFELKDGLYDKSPTHLFREWELLNYAYERMTERLRKWVDPLVYTFPYDWRKPLEQSAARLAEFMDHVRGKLQRNGDMPELSFVTHSMGGLLLRSALNLHPQPLLKVGRIVFVAPPFRGSCDIPKTLVAGERNGWLSNEEDFRKLARSFPSVYQLIPSFPGAAVSEANQADLDLFHFGNWQENVTQEGKLNADFLAGAEAFLMGQDSQHGGTSPAPMLADEKLRESADRVLILLSVGYKTVFQIPVDTHNPTNKNWFNFKLQKADKLGDGRVHLKSAAVRGITLAAFEDAQAHGTVCRDQLIIKAVSQWLNEGRLIRMRPRNRGHVLDRRKRFFQAWDGSEDSLPDHIV